jgi:hypothetical protein
MEMLAYAESLSANEIFTNRASRIFGPFWPLALGPELLRLQLHKWLAPGAEVRGERLDNDVLARGTHESVWQGVEEWSKQLKYLSMLAQRIMIIQASEAPVERLNNKLKPALGDCGRRHARGDAARAPARDGHH